MGIVNTDAKGAAEVKAAKAAAPYDAARLWDGIAAPESQEQAVAMTASFIAVAGLVKAIDGVDRLIPDMSVSDLIAWFRAACDGGLSECTKYRIPTGYGNFSGLSARDAIRDATGAKSKAGERAKFARDMASRLAK